MELTNVTVDEFTCSDEQFDDLTTKLNLYEDLEATDKALKDLDTQTC